MPPPLIIDLDSIDLDTLIVTPEQIREVNLQRYEMEHLNGIVHSDREKGVAVGFKDVRDDEFWCRGHIPGDPILPGVIMLEAAAQLAAYCIKTYLDLPGFIGFGGVDDTKFRAAVRPPARLYLLSEAIQIKKRKSICYLQGVCDGQMIFETKIAGMPM